VLVKVGDAAADLGQPGKFSANSLAAGRCSLRWLFQKKLRGAILRRTSRASVSWFNII